MVPICIAFPLSLLLLRAGLDRPGVSSDALVTPAVAACPLPGLVAVRALRGLLVLFVAFLVRRLFWRKTGKICWKKCSFFVTRADYSKLCEKI